MGDHTQLRCEPNRTHARDIERNAVCVARGTHPVHAATPTLSELLARADGCERSQVDFLVTGTAGEEARQLWCVRLGDHIQGSARGQRSRSGALQKARSRVDGTVQSPLVIGAAGQRAEGLPSGVGHEGKRSPEGSRPACFTRHRAEPHQKGNAACQLEVSWWAESELPHPDAPQTCQVSGLTLMCTGPEALKLSIASEQLLIEPLHFQGGSALE